MANKILLAVEEFELASKTVPRALKLAKSLGAELKIMNVTDMDIAITSESAMIINELRESIRLKSENLVESLKQAFDLTGVEIIIEDGIVVDTILRKAKELDVDMLILGTHARKGLDKWLIGSVVEQVIAKSNIPVMVIPKNVE